MTRIDSVVGAGLCTGCGLCVAMARDVRVSMSIDVAGFLRPQGLSNLTDQQAEELYGLCPGVNGMHVGECQSLEVKKDNLWGAYNFVGTGYSTDGRVRFQGSSGGALTEIGRYLLKSGKVSAVVAAGSMRTDPLRVEERIVRDPEELLHMAGSKYAPSAPLLLLEEMRNFDGKIAFIGKPCDVAGLKLICRKNRELHKKITHFLSFFCAGVPSEKGNEEILRRLGVSRSEVSEFWHRGRGWPGQTTAVTRDGGRREMLYRDAWGGVLCKHLQWRCKICADGIGEAADLVAGDAWECDKAGYPLFGEAEGRSLLFSRTTAGLALIEEMSKGGQLEVAPLDIRVIDRMQPGQLHRRRSLNSRLLAMRLLMQQAPDYPSEELERFSFNVALSEKVKTTIGTLWRLLKLRFRHK